MMSRLFEDKKWKWARNKTEQMLFQEENVINNVSFLVDVLVSEYRKIKTDCCA